MQDCILLPILYCINTIIIKTIYLKKYICFHVQFSICMKLFLLKHALKKVQYKNRVLLNKVLYTHTHTILYTCDPG